MLEMQLMAIPWDIAPNLVLSAVALIGAFITVYKGLKEHIKGKIEIAKQTAFNLEKVEKMNKNLDEIGKDVEEVKGIMNKLKNKQEVDYEYLSKIFDNLEKDFNYYREFIISQLKK